MVFEAGIGQGVGRGVGLPAGGRSPDWRPSYVRIATSGPAPLRRYRGASAGWGGGPHPAVPAEAIPVLARLAGWGGWREDSWNGGRCGRGV